jgi:hypothetical protein
LIDFRYFYFGSQWSSNYGLLLPDILYKWILLWHFHGSIWYTLNKLPPPLYTMKSISLLQHASSFFKQNLLSFTVLSSWIYKLLRVSLPTSTFSFAPLSTAWPALENLHFTLLLPYYHHFHCNPRFHIWPHNRLVCGDHHDSKLHPFFSIVHNWFISHEEYSIVYT